MSGNWAKARRTVMSIPGMTEEAERQLLYQIAFDVPPGSNLVEFGAFLGASSSALLQGIRDSHEESNHAPKKLTVIDAFECEKESDLANNVIGWINKSKLKETYQKSLRLGTATVNWQTCVDKILSKIYTGHFITVQSIIDETWIGHELPENISFLHLDLPKEWETLKRILEKSCNKMNDGCIISFQDYAFEISGEIIIAANYLIEQNYIEPTHKAASSLFCKLKRPISIEVLDTIDKLINDRNKFLFTYLYRHMTNLQSNKTFNDFGKIERIRILTALCEIISTCKEKQDKKHKLLAASLSTINQIIGSDSQLKHQFNFALARMMCSQYRSTKFN